MCVDAGIGFALIGLKATNGILSLTTEYLMDSAIHTYGCFWLFSGFTGFGAIIYGIFMKETKGLTDKEKKELYNT